MPGVNVAPSSTSGHFVKGAQKVVNLDQAQETFFVDGPSVLETANHTTLPQGTSCFISTQNVYNPLSKMFEKSRD